MPSPYTSGDINVPVLIAADTDTISIMNFMF